MTDNQFIITHEPAETNEEGLVEKEFDSPGQFWATLEIIQEQGLYCEYQTPNDYEPPTPEQ